jgi:hypothetical protein
MANRAYVSAWANDFSQTTKTNKKQKFLETAPLSASRPSFTEAIVRAVDISETPVREWDFRSRAFAPAEIIDVLREYEGPDVAYEINAQWDLWTFDSAEHRWRQTPQRLEIFCYGREFDDGLAREQGDFLINAGFEHFFTGHAGMLGVNAKPEEARASHPEEAKFLAEMVDPERLAEYQVRTRDNIQKLFRWLRAAEAAVPLERYRLWSEGEEDLEARLDEILAVR